MAVVEILDVLGAPFAWDRQLAGMAAVADKGDPLGNMRVSSKAKAQAVGRDATALLTACGLALRSFD